LKKFNLKGIKKESVIGVTILLLALINAILQMGGLNILPITNENLTTVISGTFLVGSAIYTTYKNLNVSTASQTAQGVTDAIKNGEVLAEDVKEIIESIKKS
jgi:SPP1 family holin